MQFSPIHYLAMSTLAAFAVSTASAQEITTCRDPIGKAYQHYDGLVTKKNAGWINDAISGGVTTLQRLPNGDLDLLYVDATQKPASAAQNGAKVLPLRLGANSLSILVHFPEGAATEIYTFFNDTEGMNRFTMLVSKSGNLALVPKSAVMVGTCDKINFDLLQ